MPFPALRSLSARLAPTVPLGASALILSLQVAICAAAPEFIWRGLLVALDHPSWADFLSALLIGLNLAFFVEPAMERLRDRLSPTGHGSAPGGRRRNVLFTASLSLAFAFTSVCLHDAMVAFVSGRGEAGAGHNTALAAGVALIAAWAIVPFAVALAWQSAGCRPLAVPMGILGAASPCIAGWLFSWSAPEVVTTTIPCWAILALGYRQMSKSPDRNGFAHCSWIVVIVAASWLAIALLVDAVLGLAHLDRWRLYGVPGFFVDLRFYVGWAIGLALAPFPHRRAGTPLP